MPRDYEYHFKQNLIKESKTDNYHEALKEWKYFSHFRGGRGKKFNCICTKKNIKEITRLEHKETGKMILVGSSCISQHFPQFRKE